MTDGDAAALVSGVGFTGRAETWADLGCGRGTFTRALASLLPAGSLVHAMDTDRDAVAGLPATHGGARIRRHVGDFTVWPWPFDVPDGVLLANALHYVVDARRFLRACRTAMPRGRAIVVEYDTDCSNRWVPYPLSRPVLRSALVDAGFEAVSDLGSRPSIYRRAPLYAVVAH